MPSSFISAAYAADCNSASLSSVICGRDHTTTHWSRGTHRALWNSADCEHASIFGMVFALRGTRPTSDRQYRSSNRRVCRAIIGLFVSWHRLTDTDDSGPEIRGTAFARTQNLASRFEGRSPNRSVSFATSGQTRCRLVSHGW